MIHIKFLHIIHVYLLLHLVLRSLQQKKIAWPRELVHGDTENRNIYLQMFI